MEGRTRRDRAVDLRIAGHTYPEIAKRLRSSVTTSYGSSLRLKAVHRHLGRSRVR